MKSYGGILLIYQNATVRVCGAWIRIYYVLCSKTYGSFGGLFWIPAGSRRATRGPHISETQLIVPCITWKGIRMIIWDCMIFLFQVTILTFFSIVIFSPYYLLAGLLLQYVALFQSGN